MKNSIAAEEIQVQIIEQKEDERLRNLYMQQTPKFQLEKSSVLEAQIDSKRKPKKFGSTVGFDIKDKSSEKKQFSNQIKKIDIRKLSPSVVAPQPNELRDSVLDVVLTETI